VVTPPAEIDIAHAASFRQALAAAAADHRDVIVDLSRTVFCDSTGLRIFAVTGFDQLFPIFASLGEAVAPATLDAGQ
jgi:hypothetical protein